MTLLGADLSHFQWPWNAAQVKASGREFVVLKATEGSTWADSTMPAARKAAHAAGLIVGFYHFSRNGNVAAEAAWFVKNVAPLQAGEFLVLDQEVPSSVAWCQQWLDAVYNATGVRPLIYMNQSATTGLKLGDWSRVAKDYGLWLAKYDNAPGVLDSVPYWGAPAMKQYHDKATVPGIASPCDVDVFYGSEAQLLKYGKGGAKPAPTPTVREDDMALIQHTDRGVWLVGPGYASPIAGPELTPMVTAFGNPTIYGNVGDFDAVVSGCTRGGNVGKLIDKYDLAGRPVDPSQPDDLLGHVMSGRADVLALAEKVGAAQAPDLDEAKLAAALLADPKNVDALGAAIAAHLQLAPRN